MSDRLSEIKARRLRAVPPEHRTGDEDVDWLVAEVERLTAQRDEADRMVKRLRAERGGEG